MKADIHPEYHSITIKMTDGSTYVNHVELMRRARGAEIPDNFWNEPLIRQGGSDSFLGPRDAIVQPEEALGIDFEGEVAVIVDDLAEDVPEHGAIVHCHNTVHV